MRNKRRHEIPVSGRKKEVDYKADECSATGRQEGNTEVRSENERTGYFM